jgi:hypothetical protein
MLLILMGGIRGIAESVQYAPIIFVPGVVEADRLRWNVIHVVVVVFTKIIMDGIRGAIAVMEQDALRKTAVSAGVVDKILRLTTHVNTRMVEEKEKEKEKGAQELL